MIAVDAMGGDYAPREIVSGAYNAAQRGIPVLLFGKKPLIISLLEILDPAWEKLPIGIEDCEQVIGMSDIPNRSILRKKDSSLIKAFTALKSGCVDAVVSAGNSGAMALASSLILGRTPGISRPAIGSFVPTKKGSVFCLDLGANVDCKPAHLEQFAVMGSLFVQQYKQLSKPRVGLLSNGSEPYKGNAHNKEAHQRLVNNKTILFVGNIEPHYAFDDAIDVLVSDGFHGNLFLKTIQGSASFILTLMRQEAAASRWYSFLFWLSRNLFRNLIKKTDYASIGGAVLLGVTHPVILAHGRSKALAIENAIMYASRIVKEQTITRFNAALVQYYSQFQSEDYLNHSTGNSRENRLDQQ